MTETNWKYGKPFTHEFAKDYYGCRKLEPTETVLTSDGYDLGFYDGPDTRNVICIPVNWVGELAGDCEHPIYRLIRRRRERNEM